MQDAEFIFDVHGQFANPRASGSELDSFEKAAFTFQGGVNDGGFEVNGLTIGAEVCADHVERYNVRGTLIARANPQMTSDDVYCCTQMAESAPFRYVTGE